MQDVPATLVRRGLSFSCYEDPSRPAQVDADHAVRVNYETYLFADLGARDRFAAQVPERCGLITDVVSKRRFEPSVASPTAEFEGVTYIFETDEHRHAFLGAPHVYQLPRFVM